MVNQVTEASDIGLPPGIWPLKITVHNREWMQYRVNARNGELLSVTYRAADGTLLEVFND